MQIVIDIKDYDREWITNGYYIPNEINGKIAEAIINGTPLPKGHGRLIDADALVAAKGGVTESYLNIFAPTIIEAEREET